jgi:hypothetical protein
VSFAARITARPGNDQPAQDDPLSREIHEVESLAIDPRNPEIIYAGTWHLPWKTTDGGSTGTTSSRASSTIRMSSRSSSIPEQSSIVYASACSGIYKSENGGELFHKIQGIPATARRTRVLMQDTHHREVVYAGTTEGLYRTRDAARMAAADRRRCHHQRHLSRSGTSGHILLATDRGGVLASSDDGATFAQSNQGFSARKVRRWWPTAMIRAHSRGRGQ